MWNEMSAELIDEPIYVRHFFFLPSPLYLSS